MSHPSLDITGSDGSLLSGKRVVLCVSGSVAAYKAIDLARMMMRQGAVVRCVLSEAASKLITESYFTWATGNPAVSDLGGDMEHIGLADYGKADAVVAYPATANTIGKLANGIDDTALSTVLATALGSGTPVVVAPAMHEAMYGNVAVRRNIEFLGRHARMVPPDMSEGKAKAAEPQDVLDAVVEATAKQSSMRGRRVLIVAGPTLERIDPVRAITNTSSGRTGVLLAAEIVRDGGEVTMVYGPGRERPPAGARVVNVTTVSDMMEATLREAGGGYDIVVMAAAAADYTPTEYSKIKIDSDVEELDVKFRKTPKIIDRIREVAPDSMLVGFKAEVNISREQLIESALQKMQESGADMIVANDVGDGYQNDPESNRVIVLDDTGQWDSGRKMKEDVVAFIKEKMDEGMRRRTT